MKQKLIIIFLFICSTSITYSQLKNGDNLLGPSIGFWTNNSVPTFGANYERQITQFADVATLGLGGIFRYASHTETFESADYKYTYLLFGAQGNFNFNKIGNGKFVPFVGLVLGYDVINYSASNNGITNYSASASSGFWLWGQAGARYFFSSKVAGVIRIGAGNFSFNVLELGVDFKF
jgi:hypothetical protein